MFSCLRQAHAVLRCVCTSLQPHQHCTRAPVSPHPRQHLVFPVGFLKLRPCWWVSRQPLLTAAASACVVVTKATPRSGQRGVQPSMKALGGRSQVRLDGRCCGFSERRAGGCEPGPRQVESAPREPS